MDSIYEKNPKGNGVASAKNAAFDTLIGVLGGATGAFIGKFGALAGIGGVGAAHYFGIRELVPLSVGMITGVSATQLSGIGDVNGFSVEAGLERSKAFFNALKANVGFQKSKEQEMSGLNRRHAANYRVYMNEGRALMPKPQLPKPELDEVIRRGRGEYLRRGQGEHLRRMAAGYYSNDNDGVETPFGEITSLAGELAEIYEDYVDNRGTMSGTDYRDDLKDAKEVLYDMNQIAIEEDMAGLGEVIDDVLEDIEILQNDGLSGTADEDDYAAVMETVAGVSEMILSGADFDEDEDLDGFDDDDDSDLDGFDEDDDEDLDGFDDDDASDLDGFDEDDDDDLDGFEDEDDDDLDGFEDEDDDDLDGFEDDDDLDGFDEDADDNLDEDF